MNPLFQKLFDNPSYPFTLSTDVGITDTGDVYTAEVELAGFAKKDVSIQVSDGVLELQAKNKARSQKFKLHLNDLVAEDHISADLKNGLLKLTLPKKTVAEAREIQIK